MQATSQLQSQHTPKADEKAKKKRYFYFQFNSLFKALPALPTRPG
jgi:hypothetical protein